MTEAIGGMAQALGLRNGVALLIDGDNLPSKSARQVIARAARLGPLAIKRVYGRLGGLTDWGNGAGFRLIYSGAGKNAADLQMTIEAVDLFHKGFSTFVICSSDHDFTPLAHYLRESGAIVVGLGDARATEDFRKACSRFEEVLPEIEAKPVAPKIKLSKVDERIQAILTLHAGPDGALFSRVAGLLGNDEPLKAANLVEKNWRKYLEAHPKLFAIDPKGQDAKVRWVGLPG
jgi:hypothetical protein